MSYNKREDTGEPMTNLYFSEPHGCVYSIYRDQDSDGDYLITTPQFRDGSYDTELDNWIEVDELS